MRTRHLFATAAGAALLAVAGCDDDDETTSGDGRSAGDGAAIALSQEDFVEQANAICRAGTKELDRAREGIGEAELEAFVTGVLVPSIRGQVDAIRTLPAPGELNAEVQSFLDEAEAAVEALEADPSLIDQDVFADVNRQAEELGLTECAG